MYCENMKEIIERNVRNNTIFTAQCVCRTYRSYIDLGRYDPDYCSDGLCEHGGVDGHCFSFNRQAQFFAKKINVYVPTMDEAMKRLEEAERSRAIYTTPNTRDTTYVCTCCTDCCAIQFYEDVGLKDVRKPSRFRPYWKEDACVGCGVCVTRCNYDAIHLENGTVTIEEDKCKGCGNCVVTCPTKEEDACVGCGVCVTRCNYDAIHLENGTVTIEEDKCKGCGNCVVTCPTKALKMKIVHEPDWVPEIPYVDGWSLHDELDQEDAENMERWGAAGAKKE